MTPQKCAACHRKTTLDSKYCLRHDQAFASLMQHYKTWVRSYDRISMEDFMNKLIVMEETGNWVKEVIEVELRKK
jgi:hypothetical protein